MTLLHPQYIIPLPLLYASSHLFLSGKMSSKEYSHLSDLSQLSFLVIDEADRMIKQGSFPQLQQIFEAINDANPPPPDESDEVGGDGDSDDDDDDSYDRLRGIGGLRGEARVVMLDDSILAAIEREREGGGKKRGRDVVPAPTEMDDEEYERQLRRSLRDVEDAANEELEERTVVHRQTFVYSATLTLPPSMHHLIKKDLAAKIKTKRRKKGNNKQPTTVDGAIAEILEIAGARGETKIVDLSNVGGGTSKKKRDVEKESKAAFPAKTSVGGKDDGPSSSLLTRLPPGLTLGEIRCAQRHKDSHLYAYLVTTRQGSSGPCLVFCNSIAAVRRVGETLKTLGLPVRMLHAQMAQVSLV
jgi:ATP-dependent RNA helicase DDX24/MAK5